MSLLLLITAAQAQVFSNEAQNCLADDAWPIAGNAGLENGLSALRINAQTYNATRFAEKNLYPVWEQVQADIKGEEEEATTPALFARVSYEYNANLGVARVPLWYGSDDCPDDLRLSTSPLDVYANNFGIVGRYGKLGFYYSGSFTFGTTAFPRNDYRAVMALMTFPMIGAYGTMAAPFSGAGVSVVQGSSAYALDWVGGAMYEGTLLKARAGYVRSRGFHASVENPQSGLFANWVWRGDSGFDFSQYAAGAEQVRWGKASDKVGKTSLFTRGVPISESRQPGQQVQLRTQHIAQDSIAGRLDVAASWATEPQPLLHEAWVAIHSVGFHDSLGPEGLNGAFMQRLGAGVYQMPAQYYYGLEARTLYSARLDYRYALGDAGVMNTTFSYNDPEQLLIFPFARDAFAVRFTFEGEF